MKRLSIAAFTLALAIRAFAADSEDGFVKIFDGKTFNGWKPAEEHIDTWKIEDGAFVAHGDRCHLYYVGDQKPFKNFELKVDVMTEPNSNGGIYFHTRYQPTSWPKYGFESQVNVSHGDWIKSGSLYGLVNLGWTPAKDRQWWTQDIKVEGNKVIVHRQSPTGYQVVEAELPVLITTTSGINEPRYPSLKGIMGAKRKEIVEYKAADLGLDAGQVGESGAREKVLTVGKPVAREVGAIINDEGDGGVKIADFLAEIKVL